MHERKNAKPVRVTVESQGHVNGAPGTKTGKVDDRNAHESLAGAEKNQKH